MKNKGKRKRIHRETRTQRDKNTETGIETDIHMSEDKVEPQRQTHTKRDTPTSTEIRHGHTDTTNTEEQS